MPDFKDTLAALRKRNKLTQNELGAMLGLAGSTISMYERGEREPSKEALELIADHFNVPIDYLVGRWKDLAPLPANIIPMPTMRDVPLVGDIACGLPILAVENHDGTVQAPENIRADFALRCKGDSMINARIYDGDIVYIRQQPTVDSGQIAAVLIDDEATLKRVRIYDDHIILEAANPQYKPLVFWDEAMKDIHILGLAVAFTSAVE